MIAVIVFAMGQEVYQGPDMQYGLKSLAGGTPYVENPGWFMDEVQSWSVFFVIPAMDALLGSYMICREQREDTWKTLRIIPVDETRLMAAKMLVAFAVSVFLYLFLVTITFLTEAFLHSAALTAPLVLTYLKEYLLTGIGVFLAVCPIIALSARMKQYWLAAGCVRHCKAFFVKYPRYLVGLFRADAICCKFLQCQVL